jgi:hypothetical protein
MLGGIGGRALAGEAGMIEYVGVVDEQMKGGS